MDRQRPTAEPDEISLSDASMDLTASDDENELEVVLGEAAVADDISINSTRCYLLELPAELRNRIYCYVLVEIEGGLVWYVVAKSQHIQPGLLRTCRQIREETIGIFYSTNAFILSVVDLEIKPNVGPHWFWKAMKGRKIDLCNVGRTEWSALMPWFHALHEQKVKGVCFMFMDVCDKRFDRLVADSIRVVEAMHDEPWETTRKVLEAFRDSVERATNGPPIPDYLWY